jgi:hypothetical protein
VIDPLEALVAARADAYRHVERNARYWAAHRLCAGRGHKRGETALGRCDRCTADIDAAADSLFGTAACLVEENPQ